MIRREVSRRKLLPALDSRPPWTDTARPEQITPPGNWRVWLIQAGRGWGKTRTGAEFVLEEVRSGRARRIALIGPTAADVRDVMVEGESGILACAREGERPIYEPSKRRLTWPNGAFATTYSADEPERLRGPQSDLLWADEPASWRRPEAWDMAMFGLRLGDNPRACVTGTPKPVKLIRELRALPTTHITYGRTLDNAANLAPQFIESIISKYEGTRLGRQELDGELLEDTPGSLWQWAMFNAGGFRLDNAPPMRRIVVGVDPAASNNEDSDETGIIVAGLGVDGRGYVLADVTLRGTPNEWGQAAAGAYASWQADRIVAERNNGGDMVEYVLRTVDPNLPITTVWASHGKQTRAEPVAALYEQCIAQGILVETEQGAIPIEQVRAGDRVWTRAGLRRVEWSGQTGFRETVTVETEDGHRFIGTPDHPLYVPGRGFVHAGLLVPKSDTLEACINASIATPQLRRNATQGANHARLSIVGQLSEPQKGILLLSQACATLSSPTATGVLADMLGINSSTVRSGLLQMARFLTAFTSTTLTGIPATTTSQTLPLSALPSMGVLPTPFEHPKSLLQKSLLAIRPRSVGSQLKSALLSVIGAGAGTSAEVQSHDSALRLATRPTGIISVGSGPITPVFDLQVEGQPEFFAAGLLVHNCKVSHIGPFPELETQLTGWAPSSEKSPDRLDALVWALTELMLGEQESIGAGSLSGW